MTILSFYYASIVCSRQQVVSINNITKADNITTIVRISVYITFIYMTSDAATDRALLNAVCSMRNNIIIFEYSSKKIK